MHAYNWIETNKWRPFPMVRIHLGEFSNNQYMHKVKFSDIDCGFFFRFRFGSGELIDVCMYFFFSCVPLIIVHFSISRTPAHSCIASEILTFCMITLSFCQLLILFFVYFSTLFLFVLYKFGSQIFRSFVGLCSVYGLCMVLRWHLAYTIHLFWCAQRAVNKHI